MDGKAEQIRATELFSGCNTAQVDWIAKTADSVIVRGGETIVREGAAPREFVVVVEGVAASRDGVVFGPGSSFGHMDLLDGTPHGTSVDALTDVQLLVFDARAFAGLLEKVPSASRKLMRGLVTAMRAVA